MLCARVPASAFDWKVLRYFFLYLYQFLFYFGFGLSSIVFIRLLHPPNRFHSFPPASYFSCVVRTRHMCECMFCGQIISTTFLQIKYHCVLLLISVWNLSFHCRTLENLRHTKKNTATISEQIDLECQVSRLPITAAFSSCIAFCGFVAGWRWNWTHLQTFPITKYTRNLSM